MRKILFFRVIVWICAISLWACKEAAPVNDDKYVKVEIEHSSGDDFSYEVEGTQHYFAPYPFNIGSLTMDGQKSEFMVISKKIEPGTDLNVVPIAIMTILESPLQEKKDICIAIPENEDRALIKGLDFSKLTVEQYSLKQIIEFWYSNRYGLQGTTVEGWSPADLDDFK